MSPRPFITVETPLSGGGVYAVILPIELDRSASALNPIAVSGGHQASAALACPESPERRLWLAVCVHAAREIRDGQSLFATNGQIRRASKALDWAMDVEAVGAVAEHLGGHAAGLRWWILRLADSDRDESELRAAEAVVFGDGLETAPVVEVPVATRRYRRRVRVETGEMFKEARA